MQFGTMFKWTFTPTGERLSDWHEHTTPKGATRFFNKLKNNPKFTNVSFVTKNTKNETVAQGTA